LGKNIKPLAGIPLVAHSIVYSCTQLPETDIYVSTDGLEISDVAKEYGANVIVRPPELADDNTPTVAALQHAARVLITKGVKFDYIILLQPTQPLRPDGLLSTAIKHIETEEYDSLITVSPTYRKFGKIENERFIPWNYTFGQRSQDMNPLYYENGLVYIMHKDLILDGKIMGDKMYPMIVDHIYATVDIDTEDDFRYAEFIINQHKR
jgi:N-acylneuraminate cytidylyltransferase